jgi:hypothetical protein
MYYEIAHGKNALIEKKQRLNNIMNPSMAPIKEENVEIMRMKEL